MSFTPDEKRFTRFFLIVLAVYTGMIAFVYLLSMLITPYLIKLLDLPT